MSLATHRAALLALLQGVADIGVVHDEEPFARAEADFRNLYTWQPPEAGPGHPLPDRQIRGWHIHRTRTAERELGTGRTMNVHTWRVRGFMSLLSQGSGKAFDALVEAVRAAYRADITLGGVAQPGPLAQTSGMQLTDSSPVVLAGALCHGCTLVLDTTEYLDNGE